MTIFPTKNALRPCPICDHGGGDVIHTQRFVLPAGHPLAAGYDVVCCQRCGFAYADTTVTQQDYDEFYARLSKYTDNKTSTGGGLATWDADRLQQTARVIAAYVPQCDARILDIGCANGGLLQALRDLGYRNLCGIDPAPACVAQAAQVSGAMTYPGSLSQIPAEVGACDMIVLSHVLEHVKDLRPALDSVKTFMKSGAALYIETPDAMRYADFVFAPFQDFNTEHINHFSVVSMANLLRAAGFTPIGSTTKDILSAPNMPYPALFVFATLSEDAPAAMTLDIELKPRLLDYIALSRRVMDEIDARLRAVLTQSPEVIVWGTGQLALKLLAETALAEARIDAFVDGNPLYRGQLLQGIPIIAPDEIKASQHPIIVTSILHQQAIIKRIHELDLTNPIVVLRTE
jgi:2-polyprenyl-3-methyl-5-hydroxy-6-metoxy-1,4-benzoquinol methylase